MITAATSEQLFKYAKDNNWLLVNSSEGYVVSVFVTPAGNLVEMYFEKNKTTVRTLPVHTYKF
jgi:hypothetical protein